MACTLSLIPYPLSSKKADQIQNLDWWQTPLKFKRRDVDNLEVDVWELIKLANRHPRINILKPGPGVGGHCIPVDPNYLSFKTRQIGKPVRFVELAQEINNSMPSYVVSRLLEKMNLLEKPFKNSNILMFKLLKPPKQEPAAGKSLLHFA